MKTAIFSILISIFVFVGCASVDITKTSKGFHEATNPNDVEILMTRPTRSYVELGTLTATGQNPQDTAKLHNSIRAKAAPLGANAVIILNQGIIPGGWDGQLWATGVAIRYTN